MSVSVEWNRVAFQMPRNWNGPPDCFVVMQVNNGEGSMRQQLIWLAAAAAVTAFAPIGAQAQVTVETPGVGVHVGPPPPHEEREKVIIKERERAPVMEEREVRGGPDCKSVTVKRDTPVGSETRTKTNCD